MIFYDEFKEQNFTETALNLLHNEHYPHFNLLNFNDCDL